MDTIHGNDESGKPALLPLRETGLSVSCATKPSTVGELVSALSFLYPETDAFSWDKTGLNVGDSSMPLRKVACALDPTLQAIDAACNVGANVLVTHHPALLEAPGRICPLPFANSMPEAVAYKAARCQIALANWHTALDVSLPAQAMLPTLLGLRKTRTLQPLDRDAKLGLGQVCAVSERLSLGDLARRCEEVFGRTPRVWGKRDQRLASVCTWTGAAGDAAWNCLQQGIDCLVCGEVKYHAALDASCAGLAILELGHDVSELPFATVLAQSCVAVGVNAEDVVIIDQGSNWS